MSEAPESAQVDATAGTTSAHDAPRSDAELIEAIRLAAAAGQWDVVARLAGELEERRKGGK